jgi:hypothetical protein
VPSRLPSPTLTTSFDCKSEIRKVGSPPSSRNPLLSYVYASHATNYD